MFDYDEKRFEKEMPFLMGLNGCRIKERFAMS